MRIEDIVGNKTYDDQVRRIFEAVVLKKQLLALGKVAVDPTLDDFDARGLRPALELLFECPQVGRFEAQCTPFAKTGLRTTSWKSGSSLTLGSILTGSAAIALTFEFHPKVGVALTKIGHLGLDRSKRAMRFEYPTVPPAGHSQGLWKAALRPTTGSAPKAVIPESATSFRLWVNSKSRPNLAIFRWEGLTVPGDTARSTFWIEVKVHIPSNQPNQCAWSTRMARVTRSSSPAVPHTIDEVQVPIVYTMQPGDSNKARLLIPVAQRDPLPVANLTMRIWQLVQLSLDLEHPSRDQQMQFSALYSGDKSSVQQIAGTYSAFRKILYFGTEDRDGHFKRFRHSVVSDAGGVAYYRWSTVYFSDYGISPTENCFVSPYDAVICTLQAKNDAYWFDVAEHYRQFVRGNMGLTPIRSATYTGNPDAVRDSVIVATSNLPAHYSNLGDVFSSYVDLGNDLQQVFTNPVTTKASPVFMQWQKWLTAPTSQNESLSGPNFNPRPFSGADFAPLEPPTEVRNEILRAYKSGINVSVYTLPISINRSDWPNFDASWLLRDRSGQSIPFGHGEFVDMGNPSTLTWFDQKLVANIMTGVPAVGGVYLDTFGGGGSFLRYPQLAGDFYKSGYHGGSSLVRGGKALFDIIRKRVAAKKATRVHPDLPFVPTEAVQEFFAGRYDAAQHGHKAIPLQAQLSTFVDGLTVPSNEIGSVGATTNNPPLWNAVYHEYSRAEALGMMLSTHAVAKAIGGWHPSSGGKIGLSWPEWADYNRMVPALLFGQGMKSSIQSYFYDFRDTSLLVNRQGIVGVRDPSNAHQVQLLAFLKRLHTASGRMPEAGRFLFYGAMERPLEMPSRSIYGYSQAVLSTQENPSLAPYANTDRLPGVTRHFYEDPFTAQVSYPVASVFHSVWRASPNSNQLGLIFVNWTDKPAAWRGAFDPGLYKGFQTRFLVRGVRPDGGAVQLYTVGYGAKKTTLSWGQWHELPVRPEMGEDSRPATR